MNNNAELKMYVNVGKVFALISLFVLFTIYHFFWRYKSIEEHFIYGSFLGYNKSYLVYTPGCNIQKYDPFDKTVKRFFAKSPPNLRCSRRNSVFKINENGGITLNSYELRKQHKISRNQTDCYFYPILRDFRTKKPDDNIGLGKQHSVVFDLPIEDEAILVKCMVGNVTMIKEIMLLTPIKQRVEKRCSENGLKWNDKHENLNVILVGIDSVSKLNFLRFFKKTINYLRKNLTSFELHGYNKVGDNTYPNLVPLLTGQERSFYEFKEKNFKFFDDVDFVWKKFMSAGYRSLYAEDAPKIGTFVLNNRRGFRNPPTDYYTRPYSLAVERSTLRNRLYCIGPKLEIELYFDYLKRFVRTMGDRKFFSFVFLARLTHDLLRNAKFADQPSFDLIRMLDKTKVLNQSVLVFFSDHGIRFGGIRKTYIGKIEERMPFIYFVFPDWFLKKYPAHAANLKVNEQRLTTPYDVHATLLHLLELNRTKFSTTYGQSLLTEISPYRTCYDAMVSAHWCACQTHVIVSTTDTNVKQAATTIVKSLNKSLRSYLGVCVRLVLSEVLDARMALPNQDMLTKKDKKMIGYIDYLLTIKVEPSEALFEATVKHKKGKYEVVDEISRINKYGNESHCIDDSVMKKYCFCKDLL